MNQKKIALITMCSCLALMVILLCVVLVELGPVIGTLLGLGKPTPQPTEPTKPTQTVIIPPTTAPTEPTEPTTVPTEPTEPPTVPTEPGHTHTYEMTKKVAPTCETSGYDLYTCTGCGQVEMRDFVQSTGHQYGDPTIVEPTCTDKGYTRRVCGLCGKTTKSNYTDALGHDLELIEEHAPTCTANGYQEHRCTRCGDVVRDNVVDALDHGFGEWAITTEPSFGVIGEWSRVCEFCGEAETKPCELTNNPMKTTDNGKFIYYFTREAKNSQGQSVVVYAYTVIDASLADDMTFTPGKGGQLNVEYSDLAGAHRAYTIYSGDTLEIDAMGDIITHTSPEPTEPTTPTDPTDPTEPVQPTDPTDPTEPEQPTDPTDPTEPIQPTDPSEPTDPEQSPEPSEPSEPTEPSEPSEPIAEIGE